MIKSSPGTTIGNVNILPFALSFEKLGKFVQGVHAEQKQLESKLLKDTTKTKTARALFAAEAATKRLNLIWKRAEANQKEIAGNLYQHEKKMESELKVHGTTDLVILNSYANVIKDMNVSEITELARQGDTDAVRATLLVPALKLSPKFSKAKDVLTQAAEQAILGDDYETVQELKEQMNQAEQLELGIMKTISEYGKEIKRIKETVVAPDEMPAIA